MFVRNEKLDRLSRLLLASFSRSFLSSFFRLFHWERNPRSRRGQRFLQRWVCEAPRRTRACSDNIFNFTSRLFFTLLFLPYRDASFRYASPLLLYPSACTETISPRWFSQSSLPAVTANMAIASQLFFEKPVTGSRCEVCRG